jgi:hypothetical protein
MVGLGALVHHHERVDGQAQHGWTGKVAMVRFYDEAFNQEQVISRYTELQPAIEKLNASN